MLSVQHGIDDTFHINFVDAGYWLLFQTGILLVLIMKQRATDIDDKPCNCNLSVGTLQPSMVKWIRGCCIQTQIVLELEEKE